jgi:hypothetical protein
LPWPHGRHRPQLRCWQPPQPLDSESLLAPSRAGQQRRSLRARRRHSVWQPWTCCCCCCCCRRWCGWLWCRLARARPSTVGGQTLPHHRRWRAQQAKAAPVSPRRRSEQSQPQARRMVADWRRAAIRGVAAAAARRRQQWRCRQPRRGVGEGCRCPWQVGRLHPHGACARRYLLEPPGVMAPCVHACAQPEVVKG